MNSRIFSGIALGAILVTTASNAATIRYRQSGNWTETAPANDQPGWQNVSTPPGVADVGRINWGNNTVTLTTNESIGKLQVGVDEQGNLAVANGGTLTTVAGSGQNGDLTIGQGNNPAGTGMMLVEAGGIVNVGNILYHGNLANGTSNIFGTVNVGSHLWTGWNPGVTGEINVNDGGIINVTGMLGLNWRNNGAIGLLNINDGGIANLNQIHADGISILGSSLLTIAGSGILTKTDNFVNVIQTQYVDTGKIVGEGGAALDVSYDPGSNLTFVTVIPEPSTLGLLGAFGAFAFLRRRRS